MGRPRKTMPPVEAEPIECGKCGETKPPIEFYWSSAGRLQARVCRPCWYYECKPVRQVTCGWCGKSFETTYTKAMFCSRPCKDLAKNRQRQDAIDALKPHRVCPTCGTALTRKHRVDATFCSVACSQRAHNVTRKIRRRVGEQDRRRKGVQLVSLSAIAKRDNHHCGICGGSVDMDRRHPDPLAASIDHIVPLAVGGTNEPSNLQLSHFRCNWSKKAKV